MAPPTLYHEPASPASRTALLAAKAFDVKVEVKSVQLAKLEHLRPEFLELNPLHTVPVLVDDGFVLVDSHAIAIYLAEKYGKNEKLYPKDINKRSLVNQQLFFDAGILFRRLSDIVAPILMAGADISEESKAKVEEALKWLEGYLTPTGWVAGDHITIADVSCVTTVTSYTALGFDLSKYPKVKEWVNNCQKSIPDFDGVNTAGVAVLDAIIKHMLKSKKK